MIRPMTVTELELVLDWAADEGWNPGLDDAAAFYAADPAGFLIKEVDGQPVAAISVVNASVVNLFDCAFYNNTAAVGGDNSFSNRVG